MISSANKLRKTRMKASFSLKSRRIVCVVFGINNVVATQCIVLQAPPGVLENHPMICAQRPPMFRYFPAILCAEFDSPIDALIALCVPHDEAMALVAASWNDAPDESLIATIDGGRHVATLRTPDGRWAACHAFLDHATDSRQDAERRLKKLLKRGRRGYVGQRKT